MGLTNFRRKKIIDLVNSNVEYHKTLHSYLDSLDVSSPRKFSTKRHIVSSYSPGHCSKPVYLEETNFDVQLRYNMAVAETQQNQQRDALYRMVTEDVQCYGFAEHLFEFLDEHYRDIDCMPYKTDEEMHEAEQVAFKFEEELMKLRNSPKESEFYEEFKEYFE